MKKLSPLAKRLVNIGFITLTLGVVVLIAFSNSELQDAWGVLFTLSPLWLFACLLGWFAYLLLDATSMYIFFTRQKYKLRFLSALHMSTLGFYYSSITPGASGGQPMQVYYANKKGIPIGVSTSAVAVKFFCSQFAMVFLGGLVWILHNGFVQTQLSGVQFLVILGMCINGIAIPGIVLIGYCRRLVQVCAAFFVRLGARMHIIKDPPAAWASTMRVIDNFHSCMTFVRKDPKTILIQLGTACAQLICFMSITYFVYRAFGFADVSWDKIVTIALLLYISSSYTPLPGASGMSEGGFLLYFKGIFTEGTVSLALLVWRLFTYYIFIIIGAVVTLVNSARGSKDPKRASEFRDEQLRLEREAQRRAEDKDDATDNMSAEG
ncbi:MAG: lysylphosphatidylglycerol synthase transmembrane domain-containing protein [Eubacteriales bacterium]|nr:lysylphosphatidylglycerol synthase transmembrane domain-containing protein [Eubacteriales bacterium]MDD3882834.1 lysylphosphatidylglycerol synthase transmembrane domain-containing protein [Eubacteriales bacterium]MDD4513268.1 lysylphosphatidylglycerol synthase transmembrane domain-containing protein [Eubacteriales bacterium]